MIFGGKEDGYQKRYLSLEESMIGHELAVERARNSNVLWSLVHYIKYWVNRFMEL